MVTLPFDRRYAARYYMRYYCFRYALMAFYFHFISFCHYDFFFFIIAIFRLRASDVIMMREPRARTRRCYLHGKEA